MRGWRHSTARIVTGEVTGVNTENGSLMLDNVVSKQQHRSHCRDDTFVDLCKFHVYARDAKRCAKLRTTIHRRWMKTIFDDCRRRFGPRAVQCATALQSAASRPVHAQRGHFGMSFAHWDKLLYGIEKGECILFLGPELPVESPDGLRQIPAQALARRLLRALDDEKLAGLDPQASDLSWIAQRYVVQEDQLSLEGEIESWHREWLVPRTAPHDNLAALPFRRIVTC